ncbi:LOW QUALITY PROTEIN: mastermind-like protein 1 [Elysia marginata]|uniref:Mastermind-like protein 1 n=1 Tax=Elysia marginata TaxID=1093978 RepID=A0AAV4HDU4_9GAST|nr:LOW QUALITY PROTEIN: mastermind-like protein 1 [Elysia marginata]
MPQQTSTFEACSWVPILQKLKRKIDSVSGIDANNASSATNNNNNNNNTSTTPNTAANLPEASVFNFDNNDGTHSAPKISKNSSSGGGNSTTTSSSRVNATSAVGPGLVPRLSVQIVQEFSGHPRQDASQTIETNVTVSSRYSTGGGGPGGGDTSPNSHSVHTSVECKQEPASNDDPSQLLRPNSNNSSGSNNNTPAPLNVNHHQQFPPSSNHLNNDSVGNIGVIDLPDVDELQNILESIEKNEQIDPSVLKELAHFNEICDKVVQQNSESGESAMYGSQSKGGGNVFPGLGTMFDPPQPMGGVPSGPNIPMSGAIPEPTGPAAETLKQLAAHHQHQRHGPPGGSPGYGMKGTMMGGDPFMDGIGSLRTNGGFPSTYPQMYRSHGPSPTGQAPNYPGYDGTTGHHGMGQMTPEMAAAMGYNSTKPLSHFQSGAVVGNGPSQMGTHAPHSLHHSSPSSLQQLQNQVQSHFKPGPGVPMGVSGQGQQLQMTQSQHMQVSHGPHSLQMSQTQQVHIQQQQHHQQTPHQQQQQHLALSQQQNFSISQQQMVSEQVKMQMMEKMRMEQQQQQQQQQQHHQQQHPQQHPHHHQRMPPQYMGRPPPEYKMHPNARHGPYANAKPGSGGVMGSGMNQNTNINPLQTMQNMVNQTTAYGAVKTEIVTAPTSVTSTPGSGMQPPQGLVSSSTTQISAVQQQTITLASDMGTNVPQQTGQVNGTVANRPGFNAQPQQMQQPPSYSSSLESASTISRTHTSSSLASTTPASTPTSSSPSPPSTAAAPTTYTSAIMRNQRPPNVNVGPDGLNISHSRPHTDWPVRGQGSSTQMMQGNMRPSINHPGAAGMQAGHMMQYGARPPHYGAPNNMAAAAAAAASNMAQLQQHGQVGGVRGQGVRAGPMLGGTGGGQMMMQRQQSMHMSQQMAMHASSTGYSMGGPAPGGASGPNVGYALGGPSPGAPSSDFGMTGPSSGTPGATAGYVMGGPSPGLAQTNSGYGMGGPSPGAGVGSNHGAYGMGGPSPGLSGSSVGGYPMGGGPSPGANTPMHAAAGGGAVPSNQQPTAVQPTGFPPPNTPTPNQDAFLHFLDNPLSSQFDSIQTSTSDDFNLLEDILNCK